MEHENEKRIPSDPTVLLAMAGLTGNNSTLFAMIYKHLKWMSETLIHQREDTSMIDPSPEMVEVSQLLECLDRALKHDIYDVSQNLDPVKCQGCDKPIPRISPVSSFGTLNSDFKYSISVNHVGLCFRCQHLLLAKLEETMNKFLIL